MPSLNKYTEVLGAKNAAHLLRRSTFGPSAADIDTFAAYTAEEAFDILVDSFEAPEAPIDPATGSSWVNPPEQHVAGENNSENAQLLNYLFGWYIHSLIQSGNCIQQRMNWFLHTLLPVSYEVVSSSEAIYYQLLLYQHYALGNFKSLFKKFCLDNASLIYLDGNANDRTEPNENFAREMFELYSIGKGPQIGEGNYTHFTEQDVQAAARVLTGWKNDNTFETMDSETLLPTGYAIAQEKDGYSLASRHDAGTKTFSAAFNSHEIFPTETYNNLATTDAARDEINEMIEMIFSQKETARHFCRKLYRFFVYYKITPAIENDIIEVLATTLMNNNYEIKPVLKQLLCSQHFFDADNAESNDNHIGAIIKSPLELVINSVRFFGITFPDPSTEPMNFYTQMQTIQEWLGKMEMDFFKPFDVAGYPAYHQVPAYNRNWITPNALAYRYYFGFNLMSPELAFRLDIVDWVENSGNISQPDNANILVTELIEKLFPVDIPVDRKNFFLEVVFLDNSPAGYWTTEWNAYTGGGADDTVRMLLERLLAALMKTPEFQLF